MNNVKENSSTGRRYAYTVTGVMFMQSMLTYSGDEWQSSALAITWW